jgi:hypothetical protein
LDYFAVDLAVFLWWTQKKRILAARSFFSHFPPHLARSEKMFYIYPSKKRELPGVNDSGRVLEGVVTTP